VYSAGESKKTQFILDMNEMITYSSSSSIFSGRYGGWHGGNKEKVTNQKNVPRVLVYVMGGATFSEFRVGYEVSNDRKNWEVIVGK